MASIVFRTVHSFGAGESAVGAIIADLMDRRLNPLVGTTVADGIVSVRVTAKAESKAAVQEMAARSVEEIQRRLANLAFGVDDDTMSSVVGSLLRQKKATVSVAESCTGGLLGKLLTDISGSSDYFIGGVICYSNQVKQEFVGVKAATLAAHGAVSEDVAGELARNTRAKFGTTYALSITGIAGPLGGTEAKPVGLVYTALDGPSWLKVQKNFLPGPRERVRLRSALFAMNMLRLELI